MIYIQDFYDVRRISCKNFVGGLRLDFFFILYFRRELIE